MRVAIVVGHSQKAQGARNSSFDVSEFEFNRKLAHDIANSFDNLFNLGEHEIGVVYRKTNYKELPEQVNELNPDLIISLHANF